MEITQSYRNKIQADMFHSVYRLNADLSPEERFARAIVLSSDEVVDDSIAKRPKEMLEYYLYGLQCEAENLNRKFDKARS